MKRSVDRVMTTHVGSLPRPSDLVELYRDDAPDNKLLPRLRSAVAEVVRQQAECGIDVVNDGEFGKAMRCGLGGRVHPQIAWAKLAALAEGAKLASSQLWR
jgi:5-methyltetrahydropteroyltriglutamate--homocysteine methyltransferase